MGRGLEEFVGICHLSTRVVLTAALAVMPSCHFAAVCGQRRQEGVRP